MLAFVTLLGWKLGVIESVSLTILAGFSVDYVVSLHAGSYHKRSLTDRELCWAGSPHAFLHGEHEAHTVSFFLRACMCVSLRTHRFNELCSGEKTREAFANMGVSVLSGMLTSVGASVPLFFTTLMFFSKFGGSCASFVPANVFALPSPMCCRILVLNDIVQLALG